MKIGAPPQSVRPLLPPRWRIEKTRYLMTCAAPPIMDRIPVVENYRLHVTHEAAIVSAIVTAPDESVISSGRAALTGEFAIYDSIETRASVRRRGLATLVMQALQKESHRAGNTRGILVATGEGRPLYEKLGWQLHCLYTSAVISA